VARYLVEKGSICVDGVSLTLGPCERDTFAVYLIPHTLSRTTLQFLRPGDAVNLEADIIGKYVEKMLERKDPKASPEAGVSRELLEKYGFVSLSKK
jgi:riboflavin synthase